jgi:hypothetical protein
MTRLRIVLFISILLSGRGLLAQRREPGPQENYLGNPGFEQGSDYWQFFKNPNADIAIDDRVWHSGKHSLRMEYNAHVEDRLGLYMVAANQLNAILVPGRIYTFSGWIKIAGVPAGKLGPIAYLCEAQSGEPSKQVQGNTDPAKNDGWVFVSMRYKAPAKVTMHQFRCQCHTAPNNAVGTAWFDDLKLEEGETATAFRPDWVDPSELYSQEHDVPWLPVPLGFRSSLDVVTPHVEMARGFVGGKPRVLWAGFYNNARLGCELAERGDLVLDSVVVNGSSTDVTDVTTLHAKCVEVFRTRLGIEVGSRQKAVGSGQRAGERSDNASLPTAYCLPPTVLVIEQGMLELLNKTDRMAIVERIAQGMGCVVLLGPIYKHGHPGAIQTPKIQELVRAAEALRGEGSGQRAEGSRQKVEGTDVGRSFVSPSPGRVVVTMNAMQNPQWSRGTAGIEASYSDILQAVYQSIGWPVGKVGADTWPKKPIAGQSWNAIVYGKAASVRVRVIPDLPAASSTLNDGYGVSVPRNVTAESWVSTVAKSSIETRVSMHSLPGGKYMLLVQALNEQRQVVDWTLTPFTVDSSIEIVKLEPLAGVFMPNAPLKVRVTVKNYYRTIPDANIVAELTDFKGRLLFVSRTPVSIAAGQTTHELPVSLSHSEHCAVQLKVSVEVGNARRAAEAMWLSAERVMPKVDFHVGGYDDFNDGWSRLGADMNVGPACPELGLRPFPWINLIGAMGPSRDVCDPQSIEKAIEYVTTSLVATSPCAPLGCILHDELDTFGFSSQASYAELEFFRQYLKETYKDLQALNASWRTHYGDWSEIDDKPAKINMITLGGGSPAAWADWHRASELAAHRFYGTLDKEVGSRQKAGGSDDLPTPFGPSGTRDTNGVNGIDWWLLAQDFRSICMYHGIHTEMYRSFAPAGRVMTNWSHLDALDDSGSLRVRLWHDVLGQCSGAPVYGGRYSNVFFPDYRPKPGILAYAEELAAVRSGFGRLISGARRNDEQAAIYYSPACYRARIVDMKDVFNAEPAQEENDLLASLSSGLADLRIGSHFISYAQVARGDLDPQRTRALFLWGALSLSDEETAAIRRYLLAGGTVVADCLPGLYDEHCHARAQSPFADCLPPGGEKGSGQDKLLGDWGLEQAAGTAGNYRTLIPNRQSLIPSVGKFILFSGFGSEYVKLRGYDYNGASTAPSSTKPTAVLKKLQAMLQSKANLKPNFRLCDLQGHDFAHSMMALDYIDGDARYFAAVPEGKYGESLDAALTTNSKGYLYDCRLGRFLGERGLPESPLQVKLQVSTGNVFAMLPYRVKQLELSVPSNARPGQPLEVQTKIVADGSGPAGLRAQTGMVRHVIVLQWCRPDGQQWPEDRMIVETTNGLANCKLTLALNDSSGKWTLFARDVATGVHAEAVVDVK